MWVTDEQKSIMLTYMKSHPQLALDKISPTFRRKERRAQWVELSCLLNGCGRARHSESWRATWKRFLSKNSMYKQFHVGENKKSHDINSTVTTGTSRRRISVQANGGVEAFVQEKSVTEGNAHQYKKKKPRKVLKKTVHVNECQGVEAGCSVPQSTAVLKESAEVSNPEQSRIGDDRPCHSSCVEKMTKETSNNEEINESYTPQSTSERGEIAEGVSQEQQKKGKTTTSDYLKTITGNVVKTQQSMVEAVWALVKVQERRALAEESMAESAKKCINLLENWLHMQ